MSSLPDDPTRSDAVQQVLTFVIGDATYGISIPCVQEIRGWSAVTRLPQSPPEVLGVLNLRGAIVPIVDLRLKFGSANVQYTPVTVIIVVSVKSAKGTREFGMVVDGVSDVIDIAPAEVKPAPDLGASSNGAWIKGLVQVAGRMVVLVDVDLLIGAEQISMSTGSAPQAA